MGLLAIALIAGGVALLLRKTPAGSDTSTAPTEQEPAPPGPVKDGAPSGSDQSPAGVSGQGGTAGSKEGAGSKFTVAPHPPATGGTDEGDKDDETQKATLKTEEASLQREAVKIKDATVKLSRREVSNRIIEANERGAGLLI